MGILGKIITYSLSSDMEVEWTQFFSILKQNGIPYELMPSPTFKNKERCVLNIKEVRRSIVKVLDYNLGVSVRANGGAVFIPQENIEGWIKYQTAITDERIKGIDIIGLDIADTAENKRTITKGLLNEIKENIRQETYKLKKEKPQDAKLGELIDGFLQDAIKYRIKIDATGNMYNRLLGLQSKVKKYEKYLNADLSYITKNLDTAIAGFKEIYDERKDEYIDNW